MKQDSNCVEKWFSALGTANYIKLFDKQEEPILELAIERIKEIEERMSAFLVTSDISKINAKAGTGLVPIQHETMNLLKNSVHYASISRGAFDMTIRPLVELWGIGKKDNYIPCEDEIQYVLPLVNYQNLILDEEKCYAGMQRAGQCIDLGGIAKGYAADEVKRILQENHIKDALINLGGNVVTMGHPPGSERWKIGIQNPMAPTGTYLGVLSLSEKTVVTSGSNERFFIKDGIRYHHILDARTGYPACSGLLSVTVVADNSMEADALTTALFVMGVQEGMNLLKNFQVEAIFITEDHGIYVTDKLRDYFSISK